MILGNLCSLYSYLLSVSNLISGQLSGETFGMCQQTTSFHWHQTQAHHQITSEIYSSFTCFAETHLHCSQCIWHALYDFCSIAVSSSCDQVYVGTFYQGHSYSSLAQNILLLYLSKEMCCAFQSQNGPKDDPRSLEMSSCPLCPHICTGSFCGTMSSFWCSARPPPTFVGHGR